MTSDSLHIQPGRIAKKIDGSWWVPVARGTAVGASVALLTAAVSFWLEDAGNCATQKSLVLLAVTVAIWLGLTGYQRHLDRKIGSAFLLDLLPPEYPKRLGHDDYRLSRFVERHEVDASKLASAINQQTENDVGDYSQLFKQLTDSLGYAIAGDDPNGADNFFANGFWPISFALGLRAGQSIALDAQPTNTLGKVRRNYQPGAFQQARLWNATVKRGVHGQQGQRRWPSRYFASSLIEPTATDLCDLPALLKLADRNEHRALTLIHAKPPAASKTNVAVKIEVSGKLTDFEVPGHSDIVWGSLACTNLTEEQASEEVHLDPTELVQVGTEVGVSLATHFLTDERELVTPLSTLWITSRMPEPTSFLAGAVLGHITTTRQPSSDGPRTGQAGQQPYVDLLQHIRFGHYILGHGARWVQFARSAAGKTSSTTAAHDTSTTDTRQGIESTAAQHPHPVSSWERAVNLTAHPVRVIADDGRVLLEVAPHGQIARVVDHEDAASTLNIASQDLREVAISTGEIQGLPEPEVGTLYIVSRLTAQGAPERNDLRFPFDEVRDDRGQIIGCRRFARVVTGSRRVT